MSKLDSSQANAGITRREFLVGATLGAAGVALGSQPSFALPTQAKRTPPNLLFIHTDQQHFQALSGIGSKLLRTPNMDRLLNRGTAFSLSYSPNPVCCPARAGWFTGRASCENGMLSNNHKLNNDIPDLGQWFGSRGYECFYSGKWHMPGRPPSSSFKILTADPSGQGEHSDPIVSRSAQAFLRNYRGDKPFFLSLGFLQPHDCCYWNFVHGENMGELACPSIERDLPTLPDNYEWEAKMPADLERAVTQRRKHAEGWTDQQWRYYMWSYYRNIEMVDAQIGRVLDALEDSRYANDTMIVFTTDHGDGLARRKIYGKWLPFDEAIRVPLVVCLPGESNIKQVDTRHVVSGLDIAPTMCDYAAVDCLPKARGRSLRPILEDRKAEWREFVVSECNITGRMLRTPEYKLISYKDDPVKMLFDMRKDPWEKNNLATDSRHSTTLADLQKRLGEWESRLEVAQVAVVAGAAKE